MKISYNKILSDCSSISDMIDSNDWVDGDTILVCCQPDYSALPIQLVNHSLSGNQLREQLFFEIPLPSNNYVFNRFSQSYEKFDKYLVSWVSSLDKDYKYLFLSSHIDELGDRNYSLLTSLLRNNVNYQLGTLYLQEKSIIKPSYSVEQYKGVIQYEWEKK